MNPPTRVTPSGLVTAFEDDSFWLSRGLKVSLGVKESSSSSSSLAVFEGIQVLPRRSDREGDGVSLAPLPLVSSSVSSPVAAALLAWASALRLDCFFGLLRESFRRRDMSSVEVCALVRKLASIPWCSVSSVLLSLA